jgi:hypothetical protein
VADAAHLTSWSNDSHITQLTEPFGKGDDSRGLDSVVIGYQDFDGVPPSAKTYNCRPPLIGFPTEADSAGPGFLT